jgi:D-glycero-D-manno-heptose 1,7-bisphosphate phosphatase
MTSSETAAPVSLGGSLGQAVILVGGLGTRLGALTRSTPKPLLPVGDRPFLAHLVESLAAAGFAEVVLLAGYLGEQVSEWTHQARLDGCRLRHIIEEQPAGTGGALWLARDRLQPDFALLNGDSWMDMDFADLRRRFRAAGSRLHVALRAVEDAGRYGVATLQGDRIASFAERPAGAGGGLINSGVYWVDRSLVALCGPPPRSLERDVMPELCRRGEVSGHEVGGFFIDIGIPEDLARARALLPAHVAALAARNRNEG